MLTIAFVFGERKSGYSGRLSSTKFWVIREIYSMLPPNYLNWKGSSSPTPWKEHGCFFNYSTGNRVG